MTIELEDTGQRLAARRSDPRRGAVGTVRVLTYNILAGGGSRLPAIEAVVRDSGAAIIGLQEVNDPAALETLAARLGMHAALALSASGCHVGVLARWPIAEARADESGRMLKTLLAARVALPDGRSLRVFVTHLAAEYADPWAGEGRRLREIAHVLDAMRAARTAGEPHLLMGDLNSLAPGERLLALRVLGEALAHDSDSARGQEPPGLPRVRDILPGGLRWLCGPLALAARRPALAALGNAAVGAYMPRAVVRRIRAAGYVDCYAALRPQAWLREGSCPAQAPAGRIDYIFADPVLAGCLTRCDILRDTPTRPVTRASDHCPVLAEFRLPA